MSFERKGSYHTLCSCPQQPSLVDLYSSVLRTCPSIYCLIRDLPVYSYLCLKQFCRIPGAICQIKICAILMKLIPDIYEGRIRIRLPLFSKKKKKKIANEKIMLNILVLYTSALLECLGLSSISTEISLCASKALSLSLGGAVPNLAAEITVDVASLEPSSIRLLIRTSIELA